MGGERLPDLGIRKREMEFRWHHADHQVAPSIHDEMRPECFPASAELPLPQCMTQHCQPLAAHLFFWREDTAENRLYAERRPEVGRHAG
jgi:hypothetical protein